jgi:hypothetical protein
LINPPMLVQKRPLTLPGESMWCHQELSGLAPFDDEPTSERRGRCLEQQPFMGFWRPVDDEPTSERRGRSLEQQPFMGFWRRDGGSVYAGERFRTPSPEYEYRYARARVPPPVPFPAMQTSDDIDNKGSRRGSTCTTPSCWSSSSETEPGLHMSESWGSTSHGSCSPTPLWRSPISPVESTPDYDNPRLRPLPQVALAHPR